MARLEMGYLFKKKYITHDNKNYEVFEFQDYVTGIHFTNSENNDYINVISGDNAGTYASIISENENESDYVFLKDSLESAIKNNDNSVNFDAIRKKRIERTTEYYLRDDNGNGLEQLINKNLIEKLNNDKQKNKNFTEQEFTEETDISEMYSNIKKTIISQDKQIMQILTALFKNQKVVNSNLDEDLIPKLKENILIYGSTGTGKTEILKRIAKLSNVPIVIEDTTSLSETGYQGRKITDMLEDLYQAADGNMDLAEKGILVLDEFDKIAEKEGESQAHVSRLGVQRSLLKLLDGTLFYFDNKKFDTSKLTVVGLGAFTTITKNDEYKHLETKDFIDFGIMRELMGRFSKTISMNSLNKDDIKKILKESDFSPINTYKKLFEILSVSFDYNDDFIDYIAEEAMNKKSGARSIKTVFDDNISSALFRIFAGEYTHISLVKPTKDNENPYVLTKGKQKEHNNFFLKRKK